jgi:hypothetical protein
MLAAFVPLPPAENMGMPSHKLRRGNINLASDVTTRQETKIVLTGRYWIGSMGNEIYFPLSTYVHETPVFRGRTNAT